MEMCYDGQLVMPNNFVFMNEEEMGYCEASGTITVVLTEAFLRDCITAGCCVGGGIVGLLVAGGASAGTAAAIGSIIGGGVGWIVGGAIARGTVHGSQSLSAWLPKVKSTTFTIY